MMCPSTIVREQPGFRAEIACSGVEMCPSSAHLNQQGHQLPLIDTFTGAYQILLFGRRAQ
jgi:hypothetical protein